MSASNIPVLLTSSVIAYDTSVAMTNTEERKLKAIESIQEWLALDPALSMVLCDGSNFDFSDIVASQFPEANIECIHFANDQDLVRQRGRGYGEGEIVRYAINHSKLISEAGCFAKCTSKLWVENFSECLSEWNGRLLCKGVFNNVFSPCRPTEFSYIDTRFYIASVAEYRKHFANAHQNINAEIGQSLEECFRDAFLRNNIKGALLSVPPVICGTGGGTGTYYRNRPLRRLKEKLRLLLVRRNEELRPLFAGIQ